MKDPNLLKKIHAILFRLHQELETDYPEKLTFLGTKNTTQSVFVKNETQCEQSQELTRKITMYNHLGTIPSLLEILDLLPNKDKNDFDQDGNLKSTPTPDERIAAIRDFIFNTHKIQESIKEQRTGTEEFLDVVCGTIRDVLDFIYEKLKCFTNEDRVPFFKTTYQPLRDLVPKLKSLLTEFQSQPGAEQRP